MVSIVICGLLYCEYHNYGLFLCVSIVKPYLEGTLWWLVWWYEAGNKNKWMADFRKGNTKEKRETNVCLLVSWNCNQKLSVTLLSFLLFRWSFFPPFSGVFTRRFILCGTLLAIFSSPKTKRSVSENGIFPHFFGFVPRAKLMVTWRGRELTSLHNLVDQACWV